MRVQKRLATEEAYVANPTSVQNFKSGIEPLSIHPSQVFAGDLAVRKIAEITSGVTGIRYRDITQGGTAVADEAQHVPDSGLGRVHARQLDAG